MVNDIIQIINNGLIGIHADEKIYPLAQTFVYESSGGVLVQGPGVLSVTDDIKYVGIDDVDSIIIYHKINTIQTRVLSGGTGNKTGDIKNTYSISMLCFWRMAKVALLPDQMVLMLQARMPSQLITVENVKTCSITGISANINTLQVHAIEYGNNSDYRLPTDMGLLQYNYQIEATVTQDCLKKCINC